ncbi:MAG: type II toxin-antitoxin system prevent-host-death family antitoxin [Azospirillaceae bacterium]|nr:type II toxin-antitoxin system prevent-host-death family antitoxin [Azospirillaceae bacterium]
MGHATYTDFRRSLAGYMDRVCDERAPLTVTRQTGRSVVVISEEEYDSLLETLHLIKSPINADRLVRAISQLDAGKGTERDLIE